MFQILMVALAMLAMVLLPSILRKCMPAKAFDRAVVAVFWVYMLVYVYVTLLSRDTLPKEQFAPRFFRTYRESFALDYGKWDTIVHLWKDGLPAGIHVIATDLLVGSALNVLLYVPMGFLLPLGWPMLRARGKFPWRVLLVGFGVSLLTECVQWVFQLGWFDLDDLLNNVLGTLAGAWLYLLCVKLDR